MVALFSKFVVVSMTSPVIFRRSVAASPVTLNSRRSLAAANQPRWKSYGFRNRTTLYYSTSAVLLVGGLGYAAVPLYRVFCQQTGLGGQAGLLGANTAEAGDKVENMHIIPTREITVKFEADVSSGMRWNFRPQQTEVRVRPGETALAFYTARNPYKTAVDGIATYNVVPFEAGKYFNKIQCFCFEEQRLNPGEEVDMPVFFYIDPEYADDPKLETTDEIVLSYTFFQSKPGMTLPVPKMA